MSQSHPPPDSQALLQSMLQKLKLQPGRQGQTSAQSPVDFSAGSVSGQVGETGVSNVQQVANSPVNAFGVNGGASKEFRISASPGNSNFEMQQPRPQIEASGHPGSFLFPKVHTDGDTGENYVLGQATWPRVIPVGGTGQVFPAKTPKDADLTSSEWTEGEMMSFGSISLKGHISPIADSFSGTRLNQNQVHGLAPKGNFWSTESIFSETVGQENKGLHLGNGGSGGLEQNKYTQIVSSSQNTANGRRKQRSSENKTKRWTQKIKERWKDRQASSGKKGKEDGGIADQRIGQGTWVQMGENVISMPQKEESKTIPAQTEEDTTDNNNRSTSDFEIGLGSFSLLDEIVKGQEWAKFINPNVSSTLVNHRPSQQSLIHPKVQPCHHSTDQSPGILNQLAGGHDQFPPASMGPGGFTTAESSPATVLSMAQSWPHTFPPVSMDLQSIQRETGRSEAMEDGQNQSGFQGGGGQELRLRPSSFIQPAETPYSSVVKSRLLTRKRQHHSAVGTDQRLHLKGISDGEEAEQARSTCSPRPSSCYTMDKTGELQQDTVISLYSQNSPASPSLSSSNPFAPAPRGVLRHSMSQVSEASMETITKRRRVEENRRVHFSEDLVTISSPDMDLDDSDSEEDSGAEEDSMTEQDCEAARAVSAEVASVRRPVLPAWIQALKKRNRGRKHR
ncbi:uncharacterized protein zgc:113229 [Cololabis saira]|uniref:uncharacterized protein zgc:113229 n=1 Tax=Cololabis saira TaxID=129043 RepID=UPI002AD4240E|nr:uncharacterized protein zgc:113229 [Cololabis saira]XP_061581471.1 uncharacterized protein zgc:113229 [Cololabis saira]XP_061581472.1 uncharacterized protein zgc:113229 [Cololabis saira]